MTLAMREPNASRNLRNASSIEASDVKSTSKHREVGALRREVEPDDAVVAAERLAERAAQVAGRAGDEDDGPAIGGCGHERPAMQDLRPSLE